MTLNIHFYAGLKDYFGPELSLEVAGENISISYLKSLLTERCPEAADLINISALAEGTTLLSDAMNITGSQKISLLPPPGGG